MKQGLFRLICTLFAAAVVFGTGAWVLQMLGHEPDREFYGNCIAVEVAVLAAIVAITAATLRRRPDPAQVWKEGFFSWPMMAQLSIVLVTLLMILMLAPNAQEENGPTVSGEGAERVEMDVGSVPHGAAEDSGAAEVQPEVEPEPEPPVPEAYLSLAQWESDPFLLNLNQYANRTVEGDEEEELTVLLLKDCQSEIEVRGRYPKEQLNGAGSQYAALTARANELQLGQQILMDAGILPDKRAEFVREEIEARIKADGLYPVSDNRRIIANCFVKLGDLSGKDDNIRQTHDDYTAAIEWYEASYRTAIAEGASGDTLRQIVNQMANAKDKLVALQGVDSREKAAAPKIVAALEQLLTLA